MGGLIYLLGIHVTFHPSTIGIIRQNHIGIGPSSDLKRRAGGESRQVLIITMDYIPFINL